MKKLNLTKSIKYDLWTYLKNTKKPIVLYGMGDGADKILKVLEEKEIPVCAVFASDEFVRDKIFHGFKIKKLSDIETEYSDFIILLSFATSIPDLINRISAISKKHELYAPDVPVFGTGLFDMHYYLKNEDSFEKIYSRLEDNISKKTYESILKYKLSGNINYLFECETEIEESFENILSLSAKESYLDIGAYNGDTIEQFLHFAKGYEGICAFEPDARNFRKLQKFTEEREIQAELYNAAAWDKREEITFYSRSGRNSAGTSVHKGAKETVISGIDADSVIKTPPTYIKIDAEGSEQKVLAGLSKTLAHKPKLCIAAYHRNEDMFEIPNTVLQMNGEYKIYIRHFKYIPAWDTNFYFI